MMPPKSSVMLANIWSLMSILTWDKVFQADGETVQTDHGNGIASKDAMSIDTGLVIVRNRAWVRNLLHEMLTNPICDPYRGNSTGKGTLHPGHLHERSCLVDMYNSEVIRDWDRHMLLVPNSMWSCHDHIGNYSRGKHTTPQHMHDRIYSTALRGRT
mmetsp:Transcript_28310/g.44160  ORF Transcript_28310/g.44160 Transcript_28310/m.44160 type:complete len:157 (-) Transcript_28310:355-825(-)